MDTLCTRMFYLACFPFVSYGRDLRVASSFDMLPFRSL